MVATIVLLNREWRACSFLIFYRLLKCLLVLFFVVNVSDFLYLWPESFGAKKEYLWEELTAHHRRAMSKSGRVKWQSIALRPDRLVRDALKRLAGLKASKWRQPFSLQFADTDAAVGAWWFG